jgi:hypothetical protein
LQAVDGLRPSDYLIDVARKNIEGEISVDESCNLIRTSTDQVHRTSK